MPHSVSVPQRIVTCYSSQLMGLTLAQVFEVCALELRSWTQSFLIAPAIGSLESQISDSHLLQWVLDWVQSHLGGFCWHVLFYYYLIFNLS